MSREGIPVEVLRGAMSVLGIRESAASSTFTRLRGGCINPAARVEGPGVEPFFLKWAQAPGPASFGVEARGLAALAAKGGLRVPAVLGVSEGAPNARGWLALEFVEGGRPRHRTWEQLGEGLAELHRPLPGARPGWEEDGSIGPLPQWNDPCGASSESWPTFWTDARLTPQWEIASRYFDAGTQSEWDRLLERAEGALAGWQAEGLSILHGDLWSGNVLTDREGAPVLVDPAVYRGHREVDLAMMELFGGFPSLAFDAYRDALPTADGYDVRRDLDQLYPLLVHVNLFGAGYVPGVRTRIERLLERLPSL
jgi:fructosamine-3-kinase